MQNNLSNKSLKKYGDYRNRSFYTLKFLCKTAMKPHKMNVKLRALHNNVYPVTQYSGNNIVGGFM